MKKDLFYNRTNVWNSASAEKRREIFKTGADFERFNDAAKTERLAVKELLRRAKAGGFRDIETLDSLKPGDRVWFCDRGKFLVLAVIGEAPASGGINIVVSHTDAARLDLRICPLYEDSGFALLMTSTYSFEKLAKWTTMPLVLYGTAVRSDGSVVDISWGDKPDEPALFITDVSAHYSSAQLAKNYKDCYDPEKMNVFAGSFPADDPTSPTPVKENILRILNEKFGLCEEDLVSAELELVPEGATRDVGFDGSAICGYGFDDRVAVYAGMRGILECGAPARTAAAVFVDKEEVGFTGRSSSKSSALDYFMELLLEKSVSSCGISSLHRMQRGTNVLSVEGVCGHDPSYPEIFERRCGSLLGYGIQLMKLPSHPSKVDASEADAEFLGKLRCLFNANGIVWQPFGDIERVGGFSTVSIDFSNRNMNVADASICVLSTHSPYEFVLKSDLHEACLACRAFLEQMP